jgi:hypothetical protein
MEFIKNAMIHGGNRIRKDRTRLESELIDERDLEGQP